LHAEQAPGAAVGAADPALQPAQDGDAGVVVVGQRLEELGPEALLGPAAELARRGVGLAEALGERVPGRGRAAGPGVGGEPEDGVEAASRVADGAAGGAASGCCAAASAASRLFSASVSAARKRKGERTAHSVSESGSQFRSGE
jgi:hypothetical protein